LRMMTTIAFQILPKIMDPLTSPHPPTTTTNPSDPSAPRSEPSMIPMSHLSICAILSTAFAYGCIMTTLFLLTLPMVCERIERETNLYNSRYHNISKSMALSGFAAIAGLTQLATPLVGMLSDECIPHPTYHQMRAMGKRIPYLILGTLLAVIGFTGQMYASVPTHPLLLQSDAAAAATDDGGGHAVVLGGAWRTFTAFFAVHNLGMNMVYTVMMALIPDLIPPSQTGVANGSLAMMVVTGSLFGFGMFHTVGENLMSMYKMYISVSLFCGGITYMFVLDREMFVRVEGETRRILCEKEKEKEKDVEGTMAEPSSEQTHAMGEIGVEEQQLLNNESCWNISWRSLRNAIYVIYAMLYEPISTKSFSEIASAYWIDTDKYRDFFIVTISRFFYYMGISSQMFFLYFIHDALQLSTRDPEAAIALMAMVGQTAGAITCYPVGILSDQYFGCRRKPFVYMSCIMLATGNISLLYCTTLTQMTLVCIWLGAANGIYLTMDTSLAVDTVDEVDDDYSDDTRSTTTNTMVQGNLDAGHNAAQMFGVWGVFGFLGSAIGPLSGGSALLFFGDMKRNSATVMVDADQQDQAKFYSMSGYTALFSLCAFYFMCSALSLTLVRKKSV